ncbi:non-structural maintenance of chromosomes element 4 homolog A isoform X2 [Anoplophora glabripennis]|uniref:non-structural maintenance of chromosomes element 4 homolog A isoform X2 n=1 Tax=Anoplophora glabripennis TaxID=217634 RepID=UPI000874099E|nr:non-structural maintenance of chromosomes element 4 homolog A isoform X2 [Anoplophora glabripennis]
MDYFQDENQENDYLIMRRTPQQRKLSYRNLLNKVEGIQETEDVGLQTVNELGEVIREANNLDTEWKIDDRVQYADETLLDCLVLSSASSVLKKCIEAVDVFTSTYEQSEFTNRIIQRIKAEDSEEFEPDNLLKLLEDARNIIPQVPDYNYVYGTYDLNKVPEPKPKKERVKAPKEKLQKKEPERVTSLDKEEKGIEEIVKLLHDVLTEKYMENGEEPISYYDYIIDTDSFANTVENMFYFAFLVRDGKAQLDLNRDGKPIVKPITERHLKQFRDGGGINTQVITCIGMEQWEKHKKKGFLQQHRKRNAM